MLCCGVVLGIGGNIAGIPGRRGCWVLGTGEEITTIHERERRKGNTGMSINVCSTQERAVSGCVVDYITGGRQQPTQST